MLNNEVYDSRNGYCGQHKSKINADSENQIEQLYLLKIMHMTYLDSFLCSVTSIWHKAWTNRFPVAIITHMITKCKQMSTIMWCFSFITDTCTVLLYWIVMCTWLILNLENFKGTCTIHINRTKIICL